MPRYAALSAALRSSSGGALLWLLAITLILAVYFLPTHIISVETAITGLIGLGVIAVAARWPDRSLILLVALLPIQGFVLARLWAWGIPTSIVRHLGAWKEALALGVIVAGIRNFLATGRKADTLDRIALGFIAIVALYMVAQPVIVPSANAPWSVRLLAFRQDAGFVLLMLAARHAPFPPNFLDRLTRIVLIVAVLVAGVAVFEAIDSSAWNHFVVNTIGYTRYQIGVLHGAPPNAFDIRIWGTVAGTRIIRTGSVFVSALACGFYLVLGFAVALERATRGRGGRLTIPALVLIGAALLLTQTRSAILGALIVAWLAFRPAAGRGRHWRTQLAFLVTALAILAVPAAFSTGLTKRITAPSSNRDNASHVSAFWDGVRTIEHHPLGTGLGTSAGVGQQFNEQSGPIIVPENNYLQVGIELGVVSALVFVALMVALIMTLRVAAQRRPHVICTAAWATAAGLAVTAWFLQVWINFGVGWTIWAVAGVALGAGRLAVVERAEERPGPVETIPADPVLQPVSV